MTNAETNAVIARAEGWVLQTDPALTEYGEPYPQRLRHPKFGFCSPPDYTAPKNLHRLMGVLRGMDEEQQGVLWDELQLVWDALEAMGAVYDDFERWLLFELTQAQLAEAVAEVLEGGEDAE